METEPEYAPAQAWPGMPAPPPPITLSEQDLPPAPPAPPPAAGLDRGTVREILAALFVLAGLACATSAAFLVSAVVGLFTLGGLLLVLGVLLGVSS